MALTLSDVGLEAKDQGVLKCIWIVQINGVVVFRAQIHLCQITYMRSVNSEYSLVIDKTQNQFTYKSHYQFCFKISLFGMRGRGQTAKQSTFLYVR